MTWSVASDIAGRLRDLQATLSRLTGKRVTGKELARRAGVREHQYSAWIQEHQRPPKTRLETWAQREGWPAEMFSEGGRMPAELLMTTSNGRVAEPRAAPYGAGWLWELPAEQAEGQVRTMLRRVDESVRGMIDTPNLREFQLDVVKVLELQVEGQQRPIPDWLRRIRNEVIEGTFR